MLKADIDTIKILIENEQWEDLKGHHLPGGFTEHALINLFPGPFTKTGSFANPKKGGLIEQRTYKDYSTPMNEIIEIIKNNKKEFLKGV